MSVSKSDLATTSTHSLDPEGELDVVFDHLTGEPIPRTDAIQVKLGPGKKVWMQRRFCR